MSLRDIVLYFFFQREVHAILSMEKLRVEHAGTIKKIVCCAMLRKSIAKLFPSQRLRYTFSDHRR